MCRIDKLAVSGQAQIPASWRFNLNHFVLRILVWYVITPYYILRSCAAVLHTSFREEY
jgi:hypothetical protein